MGQFLQDGKNEQTLSKKNIFLALHCDQTVRLFQLFSNVLKRFCQTSKQTNKQTKIKIVNFHNQIWNDVTAYLIFVIFFTLAKFLKNKIYTEKRQFFALNL